MSQDEVQTIDSLAVVVFPDSPVEIAVEEIWQLATGDVPERVEGYPARATSTAFGNVGSHGLAITRTPVSVQFTVGAPGATPSPVNGVNPIRFSFDDLERTLFSVVHPYLKRYDRVTRLGYLAKRAYSFDTRQEANSKAFDFTQMTADAESSWDVALQVNRKFEMGIENETIECNGLRQAFIANVFTAEVSNLKADDGVLRSSSKWEVIQNLDYNNMPSGFVFTEQTSMELLSALAARVRGDLS